MEFMAAHAMSLTKSSTKFLFVIRAEEPADGAETEGGDELMRSSDMSVIARTWLDTLDEYDSLVQHGALSNGNKHAKATKLRQELKIVMSADTVLRQMDDAQM
ncbi:hypothetical protein DOTSEDRAFT_70153 [Dothistroma septosporum NZE10]|uniref:Uncharacterized protein n=1 Tax=Dothistroma septosporum (strain NZE10 / CBS 128990) TaxID=675120 RepID=N1PUM0_DOTSN|nr:hypothetical protein DOTSEDRAFT_70153 [Dothistroma septosporum NZE10]